MINNHSLWPRIQSPWQWLTNTGWKWCQPQLVVVFHYILEHYVPSKFLIYHFTSNNITGPLIHRPFHRQWVVGETIFLNFWSPDRQTKYNVGRTSLIDNEIRQWTVSLNWWSHSSDKTLKIEPKWRQIEPPSSCNRFCLSINSVTFLLLYRVGCEVIKL